MNCQRKTGGDREAETVGEERETDGKRKEHEKVVRRKRKSGGRTWKKGEKRMTNARKMCRS